MEKACEEARSNVQGEGIVDVWLWDLGETIDAAIERISSAHGDLERRKTKLEVSPLVILSSKKT